MPASYAVEVVLDYKAVILADAPIDYWRLNELTGTVAIDLGSGAHHGTYGNGTFTLGQSSTWRDQSKGVKFDGSTGSGRVTVAPGATGTTLTIEFGFRLDGNSGDGFEYVLSNSAGTAYVGMFFTGGNARKITVGFGGADHFSNTALTAGLYYHVLISISGGNGTFYVNGVADGTFSSYTSATYARIGFGNSVNEAFNGVLKDVALYSTALSSAKALLHAQSAFGWTDITADLCDSPVRTARGFQSSGIDDLVATAPSLSLCLNNAASNSGATRGYYSPDHASKRVGWGLGIAIRFKVTANGNTRVRFVGWIESITPRAGAFEDQTVAVMALGWMNQAATTSFSGLTAQINKRDDQVLTSLLGIVTRAPESTSFATGSEAFPYSIDDLDPSSNSILDAIDAAMRSGFSRLYEKADGTLVKENRSLRQLAASDVISLTDVVSGAPGVALVDVQAGRQRDQVINQAIVDVHPRKLDAAAVVLYAVPTSGTDVTVPLMSTVTFQGTFVDPTQQAQTIGAINTLISDGGAGAVIGSSGDLPVADYDFGSAPGLTDLSASVDVTVAYGASDVTFTVTNNGSIPAYVTKLQCRGQGLYTYQVLVGRAVDLVSQTAFGLRTLRVDCPYQVSAIFAQSAAEYILTLRSSSQTMLDQGVEMFCHAGDEVSMDTLLQREISQAIAITETVTGLSVGKYFINAVQEEYDERVNLTMRFSLVPRPTQPSWAWGIAGQSEWGQTTFYGF